MTRPKMHKRPEGPAAEQTNRSAGANGRRAKSRIPQLGGAKYLAEVVNRYHPGQGTFHLLPRTDHGFLAFGTMQETLAIPDRQDVVKDGKEKYNPELVEVMDAWIREKISRT